MDQTIARYSDASIIIFKAFFKTNRNARLDRICLKYTLELCRYFNRKYYLKLHVEEITIQIRANQDRMWNLSINN